MSNVIRKSMMPNIPKPIYVVKSVMKSLQDVPCFTEREVRWIEQNIHHAEHLDFLWKARQEDPDYQVMPDELVRKPPEPEASPAAKAAMQECFDFLGIKSKRKENT